MPSASDVLKELKNDGAIANVGTAIEHQARQALAGSNVAEQIDFINDNLDRLVNAVSNLSAKLSPLADPSEPDTNNVSVSAERPALSAVATALYIINQRIDGQVQYLHDIYNRTDI